MIYIPTFFGDNPVAHDILEIFITVVFIWFLSISLE